MQRRPNTPLRVRRHYCYGGGRLPGNGDCLATARGRSQKNVTHAGGSINTTLCIVPLLCAAVGISRNWSTPCSSLVPDTSRSHRSGPRFPRASKRSGGGGGRGQRQAGGPEGQRERPAGEGLTFDEHFGPGVGDAVLVARLAHVFRLVVHRDRVDRQTTDAFAVLESDVGARCDPLSVLRPTNDTHNSQHFRHVSNVVCESVQVRFS